MINVDIAAYYPVGPEAGQDGANLILPRRPEILVSLVLINDHAVRISCHNIGRNDLQRCIDAGQFQLSFLKMGEFPIRNVIGAGRPECPEQILHIPLEQG